MTSPGPAFQERTGSCHENVPAPKLVSSDLRSTDGLTVLARIEIVAILVHYQPSYKTAARLCHFGLHDVSYRQSWHLSTLSQWQLYFRHHLQGLYTLVILLVKWQKYITVPWNICRDFHMRFLSALCTANIFNVSVIYIYLQCGDSDWKMKSTYLLAVVSKCILDLPT